MGLTSQLNILEYLRDFQLSSDENLELRSSVSAIQDRIISLQGHALHLQSLPKTSSDIQSAIAGLHAGMDNIRDEFLSITSENYPKVQNWAKSIENTLRDLQQTMLTFMGQTNASLSDLTVAVDLLLRELDTPARGPQQRKVNTPREKRIRASWDLATLLDQPHSQENEQALAHWRLPSSFNWTGHRKSRFVKYESVEEPHNRHHLLSRLGTGSFG